jgi:hypothetical protein
VVNTSKSGSDWLKSFRITKPAPGGWLFFVWQVFEAIVLMNFSLETIKLPQDDVL